MKSQRGSEIFQEAITVELTSEEIFLLSRLRGV